MALYLDMKEITVTLIQKHYPNLQVFEVSVDWLTGITDNPSQKKETKEFSPDAEQIQQILASLPGDKRKYFLEQISIIAAGIRAMEKDRKDNK
ncbi:hypothetical protein ABE122_25820 [Brevibacillus laterosporus]|uniref:hypothetical protein n=1 Tax=Brevibacillus laterosporus TaxID=1465 RepID=UPI003D1BE457